MIYERGIVTLANPLVVESLILGPKYLEQSFIDGGQENLLLFIPRNK